MNSEKRNDLSFSDAQRLEDLRLQQSASDAAPKQQAEIGSLENRLAAAGLAQSGNRITAEIDIIFASIQGIVDEAVEYRVELGKRVPALLEVGNLNTLEAKLTQYIDGGVVGVRSRIELKPRLWNNPAVLPLAERKANAAKARLRTRIESLPLEAKLGMHSPDETKNPALYISNSTIGNLNLGYVIGDLNSSIQMLDAQGDATASKLREFVDMIKSSGELDESAKKDVLEHLSVIASEAAKPADQRKMGPLRTSIEAIKSGLSIGNQLLMLWQGVEVALKTAGVLS